MEGLVTGQLFCEFWTTILTESFVVFEQDEGSFLDTVLIAFVCWDGGAVEQLNRVVTVTI